MEIKLTRGKVALVDADDFERISKYKWFAQYDKKRDRYIAVREIDRHGKRRVVSMAREIMSFPKEMIDHINHNPLDNQKHNLRTCSNAENLRNRKGTVKNSSSLYLGVSFCKQTGKWKARIKDAFGKNHWLGRFVCEKSAAIARDKIAIRLHGDFASLNFPGLNCLGGVV